MRPQGCFVDQHHDHLQRCIDEYAGRRNLRELDTIDQMQDVVASPSRNASCSTGIW